MEIACIAGLKVFTDRRQLDKAGVLALNTSAFLESLTDT